jgi:VCBS repeat-containing protein
MATRSVTGTQIKDPSNPDVLLYRYFSFDVTTAGTVTIIAGNRGQNANDAILHLFDSTGARIAYNDDSGGGPSGLDALIAMNLPVGTYVIATSEYSSTEEDARAGTNPGESGEDASFPFFINLIEGTAVTSEFRNATAADIAGDSGPVATDDSATIIEDSVETASGNVLSNDADPDSNALVVTDAGTFQGQYGVLKLNADGSYTYTVNDDLVDTLGGDVQDVFSYTVSDSGGGTDTGTLTIQIDLAADDRTITGSSRSETLTGDRDLSGSEDTISGMSGNDFIFGLDGADNLFGGSGNDSLFGGEGRDELYGASGNDTLEGGAGDDLLEGGSGNDIHTGGEGADDFLFSPGSGSDRILDFELGIDRLVLEDGVLIRSIAQRDINGDGVMDSIVQFGGTGSGSVSLLSVSGVTAGDLTGEVPPGEVFSALGGGEFVLL